MAEITSVLKYTLCVLKSYLHEDTAMFDYLISPLIHIDSIFIMSLEAVRWKTTTI